MRREPSLDVRCRRRGPGWLCHVRVGDDPAATRHEVAVADEDLARLAPDGTRVEALVEASFDFLLEREPRGSILGRFELPLIGRYFPEYEREIRRRLGA